MMDFDASTSFQQIMRFFLQVFQSVFSWLDGIKILPNVSLLSLSIAFTITGLLFTVLFAVVRNGVYFELRPERSSRSDPRRKRSPRSDARRKGGSNE